MGVLICSSVLMLALGLGTGASFNLTHQRLGNMFYLTCLVQNGSLHSSRVQFWINETERINITSTADRVSRLYNIVAYKLKPEFEGTFYCGEMDEEWSNGLGPFAAYPVNKMENGLSHSVKYIDKLGENVTLECPFRVGALSQSYNITWHYSNPTMPPELNKTWMTDSHTVSLTMANIQRENLGDYLCSINVTNPYSGEVWKESQLFTLHYPWPYWFWPSFGTVCVLVVLAALVITHFCELKPRRIPKRCFAFKRNRAQEKENTDLVIHRHLNIGNGAFGSVFRGIYKGQPCAAKLLTHHAQEMATGGLYGTTAGIQTAALEAFRKECSFLKTLQHDNIVRHIADHTEPNSNLPILVMELMDCNLKQYLDSKPNNQLSLLCQLTLCLDIAKGLQFLHSQEVIHRDLCDVNILIALSGNDYPKAKVADFGMSRILPHDYVSTTLSGLAHRVVYLPSEARDDPYHYTYSLDIYSYGVIAVQITQGKVILKSKSEVCAALGDIPESHFLKGGGTFRPRIFWVGC